jgi:hypothetical protein
MTKPNDVAQVCINGHLQNGSITRFPQFRTNLCQRCGAKTITACKSCDWPIEGISEHAWTYSSGPYGPPRYCENCGAPYPWTATALAAAKEYADAIEALSATQKTELKETLEDLSRDTPRTPLAVSRFKKFTTEAAPVVKEMMTKFVVEFATNAAKQLMGG